MLKSIAAALACSVLFAAPAPAHAIKGSVGVQAARSACIQSGGSWDAGSNTCTPRTAPVCDATGYPCSGSGGG
jgi:hypothetical protein